MIDIQCDGCIKQDVCREKANFRFTIYNVLKANTTIEHGCIVPLEDNEMINVSISCNSYYPSDRRS